MKRPVALAACAVLLFLTSCTAPEQYKESSFVAMDTVIEMKISDGELDINALFTESENMIREIESAISKTAVDSDTSIANSGVDIILDTSYIFRDAVMLSDKYSKLTDGAFDITAGTLKELWEKCESEGRIPTTAEINEALDATGSEKIKISNGIFRKSHSGTKIDFGAIGKGYAAETVCDMLEEKGVDCAILSFGGNVALVGEKANGKPFVVGVKDPYNTADVVGYLSLESGFVSVSGDYERYMEIGGRSYGHIIDPSTGYPVKNGVHSVSVVCDNGPLADALSTALFVMGPKEGERLYQRGQCRFEAIFVTDDGVFATKGLKKTFSPRDDIKVTYIGK